MKKKFIAEDMKYINYLSWPALSEDGSTLACVESRGDEESGLFSSKIQVIDRYSGKRRCLREDNYNERQPVFVNDGKSLLYLSDCSGAYQIYLYDFKTGESFQLTTLRHGITRYNVSGDGTIVFEAILWPEDIIKKQMFTEMDAEEQTVWAEDLDWRPYYITNLTYKLDDWFGMRKGEYPHIGTVSLNGNDQKIIDTKGMEAVFPAGSSDGSQLAFYGYPYDGAKGREPELFVCNKDGTEMKQLTRGLGLYADHAPIFMPDGKAVICTGFPPFEDGSTLMLPYRVEIRTGEAELLIDQWDEEICHGLHTMVANRTEYGENPDYFSLSKDGQYLYFQSAFKGRGNLYRVNIKEKSKIELIRDGETDIHSFAMNEKGDFAYIMGSPTEPAEFYLNGERMTCSNNWLRDYTLGQVEEFWTKSRDGKADIQWFLMHPAEQEEGKLYPAVLDIKGGPETIYTLNFWHEFQTFAGSGMAVIYANPRGSVGFGRKFCADAVCWKQEAMEDLLSVVDAAVEKGFIDKERIGVTGGSYGGYMTNKLIGRTDYFAAAATQRCLVNPATSYGTGDMGFISAREVPANFKMLDYLEERARGNLITYIDQMQVPLLLLHGYRDYRCSFEQAEQLFIAMKDRHPEVPVRLVMFPEENHAITRTGKLYNQIRHLSELTGWFEKYLNEGVQKHE